MKKEDLKIINEYNKNFTYWNKTTFEKEKNKCMKYYNENILDLIIQNSLNKAKRRIKKIYNSAIEEKNKEIKELKEEIENLKNKYINYDKMEYDKLVIDGDGCLHYKPSYDINSTNINKEK